MAPVPLATLTIRRGVAAVPTETVFAVLATDPAPIATAPAAVAEDPCPIATLVEAEETAACPTATLDVPEALADAPSAVLLAWEEAALPTAVDWVPVVAEFVPHSVEPTPAPLTQVAVGPAYTGPAMRRTRTIAVKALYCAII